MAVVVMRNYQDFCSNTRKLVGAVTLTVLLSACGGGGSSDFTSTTGVDSVSDTPVGSIGSNPGPIADAGTRVGTASLSWKAPVARTDGSSLPVREISGYRIYYGTKSRKYDYSIAIKNAYKDSYSVSDLPVDTYYFAMTTVDVDGRESGYSGEAVKVVN